MSEIEMEVKRVKLESGECLKNVLNDFEFVKVLNENKLSKLIIIHAVKKLGSSESAPNRDAIFIFEKPHFGLEETKSFLDVANPWVFNILEHKTESERIVFEDEDPVNGFVLLPDMKWDGKIENLYLLAIVHQKNIPSLRELNREHISLLENVRDKSLEAIENTYQLKKSKVKTYIHYRPSFYHLHVHFTHISNQTHVNSDKNHILTHVIENLKIDPDFYRKTSLEFTVKKNEPLYDLYKQRFE